MKHPISCVLALCLLYLPLIACTQTPAPTDPAAQEVYVNELFYDLSRSEGKADIVMFRVGRADAMLIATENHTILLDTGEKDDLDAQKILAYCESQNITHLDAVIVSNNKTDNIGGYETICRELTVGEVIEPFYNATGHRYTKFLRTVVQSGAELSSLSEVTTRTYDDVTFTFYPAKSPVIYDTEEDMSLVTSMKHGENDFLFCANIGEARIAELQETVTEQFDVVKLPQHGTLFDGTDVFLDQYAPTYAMISDSVLNSASYELLSLLAEKNITYYRTHDAYVCAVSNGKNITFSQH